MPTYSLDIKVPSEGLTTLAAADQTVTIVKAVGGGQTVPVAWLSFNPMQKNTVTWTEIYSVYASNTQLQMGAKIDTQSTMPASSGNTYTFQGGQFGPGVDDPQLTEVDYGINHQDPHFRTCGVKMLTCGLYQGAVVNGENTSSPLCAVKVPYNNEAVFTPIEKVYVYTSSCQNNGQVISRVNSNALLVDLTVNPNKKVIYNPDNNEFVMAG